MLPRRLRHLAAGRSPPPRRPRIPHPKRSGQITAHPNPSRRLPHSPRARLPRRPVTGILAADHEDSPADESGWDDYANDEPCPVLDPATGTCDLYSARPILCRTFGPPARTLDGNLAHCELCYTTATPDEIAACELDPAIPALETDSDQSFNAAHHVHGETLIAYALRVAQPAPQRS